MTYDPYSYNENLQAARAPYFFDCVDVMDVEEEGMYSELHHV